MFQLDYVEWWFQLSSPGRRSDALRNRQLALDAATTLLAEPGAALTVEAIARRAGLGVGTVARAFGGKDALIDAAVAGLLEPVVQRARELARAAEPLAAFRDFLAELIGFQAAHHGVGDQLDGLDLPAVTALRAGLVAAGRKLIVRAQADGTVRQDLDPTVAITLVSQTAYAVARSGAPVDAYLTLLLDGLRAR